MGEVVDIIQSVPNKGGNINTIPITVYKSISNLIAPIVVDIFNSSLSEGVLPDVLKLSRVVPVYKSGNSGIVCNYRPISILHTLSKIIEKIMKIRITNYLKEENILCKEQYGFRPGLGTSDAILKFTDSCGEENSVSTGMVYIDPKLSQFCANCESLGSIYTFQSIPNFLPQNDTWKLTTFLN